LAETGGTWSPDGPGVAAKSVQCKRGERKLSNANKLEAGAYAWTIESSQGKIFRDKESGRKDKQKRVSNFAIVA